MLFATCLQVKWRLYGVPAMKLLCGRSEANYRAYKDSGDLWTSSSIWRARPHMGLTWSKSRHICGGKLWQNSSFLISYLQDGPEVSRTASSRTEVADIETRSWKLWKLWGRWVLCDSCVGVHIHVPIWACIYAQGVICELKGRHVCLCGHGSMSSFYINMHISIYAWQFMCVLMAAWV